MRASVLVLLLLPAITACKSTETYHAPDRASAARPDVLELVTCDVSTRVLEAPPRFAPPPEPVSPCGLRHPPVPWSEGATTVRCAGEVHAATNGDPTLLDDVFEQWTRLLERVEATPLRALAEDPEPVFVMVFRSAEESTEFALSHHQLNRHAFYSPDTSTVNFGTLSVLGAWGLDWDRRTLRHELTHHLHYSLTDPGDARWLTEGLAQVLERTAGGLPQHSGGLMSREFSSLFTWREVDDFEDSYRYTQARLLVNTILKRPETSGRLVQYVLSGPPPVRSLEELAADLQLDPDELLADVLHEYELELADRSRFMHPTARPYLDPETKARLEALRNAATLAARDGSSTGREAVRHLVTSLLEDEDPGLRTIAAEALGRCGRDVVSALAVALGDPAWAVRAQAAESLGAFGSKARVALPGLIQLLLRDEQEFSRIGAACTLGAIGPVADLAAPALLDALRDDAWSVRGHAAKALGAIGRNDPEVRAALRAVRRSDDTPWVRQRAAEALGALGPAKCRRPHGLD